MTTTDTLTTRYTAAGHSEAESRAQLAGLIDAFDGDDLAAALVEDGYATADEAAQFVAAGDFAVIDSPACHVCGYATSYAATGTQAAAYRAGTPVQLVFPGMPREAREVLISGIHPACWAEVFGAGD